MCHDPVPSHSPTVTSCLSDIRDGCRRAQCPATAGLRRYGTRWSRRGRLAATLRRTTGWLLVPCCRIGCGKAKLWRVQEPDVAAWNGQNNMNHYSMYDEKKQKSNLKTNLKTAAIAICPFHSGKLKFGTVAHKTWCYWHTAHVQLQIGFVCICCVSSVNVVCKCKCFVNHFFLFYDYFNRRFWPFCGWQITVGLVGMCTIYD